MPARSAGLATRPFFATSVQRSVGPSPFCSTTRRGVSLSAAPCCARKGSGTSATAACGIRVSPSFSVGA